MFLDVRALFPVYVAGKVRMYYSHYIIDDNMAQSIQQEFFPRASTRSVPHDGEPRGTYDTVAFIDSGRLLDVVVIPDNNGTCMFSSSTQERDL